MFYFDRMSSCFLQEVEKARQTQETIIRELRAKSEADRTAHVEEVERVKVRSCGGRSSVWALKMCALSRFFDDWLLSYQK